VHASTGSGVQDGSRSSACKLEKHRQQGLVKDRNHLGEAEVAAQNRSEWRQSVAHPMHPLGCELNQVKWILRNQPFIVAVAEIFNVECDAVVDMTLGDL